MELPNFQRTVMMECVQSLLDSIKGHHGEIALIEKTLREYSQRLGIEIDFENLEVKEEEIK